MYSRSFKIKLAFKFSLTHYIYIFLVIYKTVACAQINTRHQSSWEMFKSNIIPDFYYQFSNITIIELSCKRYVEKMKLEKFQNI